MPPVQPNHYGGRKSSTGSTTSRPDLSYESSSGNPSGERRPSAGSSYFPHSHHNGSASTLNSGARSLYSPDERERQRPPNGRTHLEASTGNTGRSKNHKGGIDTNGLLSLFRTSSRPPSPDQLDPYHSSSSGSHTRKTSFSGHSNNGTTNGGSGNHRAGSAGNFASIASIASGYSNSASSIALVNNGNHHVQGQPHPLDMESDRRRSNDSYSRTSSPDRSSEQQYNNGVHKYSFITAPTSHGRQHQRTDSIKNASDAQHRRTKSTDGESYSKRSAQDQDPPTHAASPAKGARKMLLGLFGRRAHHGSSSSLTHQHSQYVHQGHNERSRKTSADDSAPSIHSLLLFQDNDSLYHGPSDRRHGNDGGDGNQRVLPGSRKGSKKDNIGESPYSVYIPVNFDMSGIKDDPNGQRTPISHAIGAETWLAPESWGVQPPVTAAGSQRSVVMSADDMASDMDMSDFENLDYGKKKLSTIRIFREDTTYTTVNCVFNITTSELSTIVGKKFYKSDPSKYHLYILRNNIVRALRPHERPLSILRKLLLQFGYTDEDKLDELSGKDNSFICRFTFAVNYAPLTTEAEFPENTKYADVNLEKRCLPTIPIRLHSKARDIVRLNVSHNQRMDLPLDFVQNCIVLRELHMAFNDLDRVPINVRSIVHLQVLDLRGNRIKNLEKAQLEDAQELITLYLQSNRLDSIPDSFQSFEYLRILNLSSNRFTQMPMVLFQIATLEELDMSFNDLSEIPDGIGRLVRLRKLWLFGNRLANLPKTMSELTRLKTLDIRRNNISSLDAVNDLPALKELLVDYNSGLVLNNSFKSLEVASFLKCKITSINIQGTGSTLTSLDMSSNNLSNLDSALFEHMQSLETLKLDNNSISSMPGEIGTLKRLKYLSISNNLLSSLPEEVGQMEALLELDVHGNNLSELPVAIWKCSLITLNASSNVLESFPDPPKLLAPPSANPGLVSTSSSSATIPELGTSTTAAPAVAATTANGGPSSSGPLRPNPLPAPSIPLQSTPSGRAPHAPPLANSLTTLCLGDNRLPDEVMYPLSQLLKLEILNLSHNYIAEVPRGKIPNPDDILELYLSGNQLTSLPAEDMERLQSLQVLHVNGNKLTTLPAELGKIDTLEVLDVGCNMLKYNISNWPYDWNWNLNMKLRYLNMSGNKRLQIKQPNLDSIPMMVSGPTNLSDFGALKQLRILGLMDVTIMDNVPENSVDRRVRTSVSTLYNMSYGMADTLGCSDNLHIWDLFHPKFQTKEDESLFALFDGRSDRCRGSSMTSHLKDRFGPCLKIELEKLTGSDTVVSALRRTFLGLDRDLWSISQEEECEGGASALVAYVKGETLYCANVGDAIGVLVKKSDGFEVVSQKHIPWNPKEASRVKQAGGFVGEKGLLNDELDVSRSFGHYHLVPIVNCNPYISTTALTEDDDFLIMASSAFWNVMSYAKAADIAKAARRDYGDLMNVSQKLRDVAISYGAKDHMVVMLIGVGDMFKKKEQSDVSDYHQQSYKRTKVPDGAADGSSKYTKPEIEPPQGDVAMVFTDIKNSTKLWESIPKAMAIAIKEHFNVMRKELRLIGGYEVKNEGDALMASFSSVPAAMLWCLKVQELLLMADWPQEVLNSVECRAIYSEADGSDQALPMYRGLSVRMGIHWGRPVSDRDAVTRRMDYYGPMVNRAARICDCADGGEICVSSDVITEINHLLEDPTLDDSDSPQAEHVRELKRMNFDVIDLGEKKLKGLETPENLHLLYLRKLAGRLTMDPSKVMSAAPVVETTELVDSSFDLDLLSVRSLQSICLRLERLASGATAHCGRASEQNLALLSLPVKTNADQDDLLRIAENYIVRIENCFSQLYMTKTGYFVDVFEALGMATDTDPAVILRAMQMLVSMTGGLDSPNLM